MNPPEPAHTPTPEDVVALTRTWIERAVIGLNLCPFAKSVYISNQIRYVVSTSTSPAELAGELTHELRVLIDADPQDVDTTLLIHPRTLTDFFDYNDFLATADAVLGQMELSGIVQIASFHPAYRFAGTTSSDPANNTNRSPYPMLHLLREASVERAVRAFPDARDIYQTNIETMRRLGSAGWTALGMRAPKE